MFSVLFICAICCSKIYAKQLPDTLNPASVDSIIISKIIIVGNNITRDKIIFREIEFKEGDTLRRYHLDSLINKSSQNLLNRSLFNFVTISDSARHGKTTVKVKVTERWYIWPIPILEFADRNINAWWETKDFSRLSYGIDLRIENFRGRMEYLNFIIQGGYDKKLSLKWTIPYLTKNQNFGMKMLAGYQLNKEVAYGLEDNRPVFYKAADGNAQEMGFATVDLTYRQKYNYLHTLSFMFDQYIFADSLSINYPDFAFDQQKTSFLSLKYLYKMDFRDYKPYPLVGYYFDASVQKQGLGILGSDVDLWITSFVFDQYINLYKRWYFAYNITALLTNDESTPYLLQPAIGYKGLEMRGYEYYVIPGQHLGIFKSNFKFEIIPRKVHRIEWIKTEKFGKIFYALYANLFFDAGYAYNKITNPDNKLSNQFLWGTGVGIDFITYYDLVIRFEYTLNKQIEHGFYINLVAPI